jgi:hypothetical protein
MDKAGPKGVAEAKKKRKKKSSKSSKTSKQLRGYFFPGYGYYGFAGSDESGGDGGGGESVREGMVIGCCPNEDINEGKIKDIEDLLARHAQYYLDKEQKEGPLSGQDIHARETIRKKLLAKKKRLQAEKDRTSESTTNVSESIDYLEEK